MPPCDSSSRLLLQVGGPHRGGTTLLADLLELHPRIDGLATGLRRTGREVALSGHKGPQNEGIFLQSVFPKFRLSMGPLEIIARTLTGTLRQNGTGWGAYAYAPGAHLTEKNETGLLTEVNRCSTNTQPACDDDCAA